MRIRSLTGIDLAFAALVLTASCTSDAQVYKWVDEKGTVNYGNKPPAAIRGGKAPTVVEDRVSVYTPDPAVAQATQNARDRSGLPNTSADAGGAMPAQQNRPSGAAFSGAAPPPPPPTAYDPCANPNDPNCIGYPVYGRRYPPPQLVQPQLQPGAIAGNVNAGNGYIPGLSSQAQPPATPAPSLMRGRPEGPGSGFSGRRDDDRHRGR